MRVKMGLTVMLRALLVNWKGLRRWVRSRKMEQDCLDAFIDDEVNICRCVAVTRVAAICVVAICTVVTA